MVHFTLPDRTGLSKAGRKAGRFDPANIQRRKRYRGRKITGIKRPVGRPLNLQPTRKLVRRRELKNEKQGVADVHEQWRVNPGPETERMMFEASRTKYGSTMFPMSSKMSEKADRAEIVETAVGAVVGSTGGRHRADIVWALVRNGVPIDTLCEKSGLNRKYITNIAGARKRQC